MWESINGELIWMDKEMGADEHVRESVDRHIADLYRSAGPSLGARDIAVGVAGGMIAYRAASRVGSWLFWIGVLAVIGLVVL